MTLHDRGQVSLGFLLFSFAMVNRGIDRSRRKKSRSFLGPHLLFVLWERGPEVRKGLKVNASQLLDSSRN